MIISPSAADHVGLGEYERKQINDDTQFDECPTLSNKLQTAIAMLNDSWEMVANVDPTRNFTPLTPPRAVLHDLFSMGVCMGGLILLLFSDSREKNAREGGDANFYDDWDKKRALFRIAQWFLAAIA